jgi:glutathione peroxidase
MRILSRAVSVAVVLLLPLQADQAPVAATNAPSSAPVTHAIVSPAPPAPSPEPSLYNFTVNSIDGKPVDLGQYRGHVALVVNTASHCGFTQQYAGLEKLYEQYKDKGLIVLAFPSNDFGNQEPDAAKDIAKFCTDHFNISFPLFEKTKTRGEGRSPVYLYLETGHGQPNWSFHKYLVDKSGKVIGEFHSQAAPDSKEVRDAIEAALKA